MLLELHLQDAARALDRIADQLEALVALVDELLTARERAGRAEGDSR